MSNSRLILLILVVVKAFPQTPALDSESILFLENRSCLGLVKRYALLLSDHIHVCVSQKYLYIPHIKLVDLMER